MLYFLVLPDRIRVGRGTETGLMTTIHSHLREQLMRNIGAQLMRNIGIINKLRYYVDIHTLKQLYYSFIYPYLTYGITSWGS